MMLREIIKSSLRWLLGKLYKVDVRGLNNIEGLGESTILVANHTSYLDVVLLYTFLPFKLTFAVNTFVARGWMLRMVKSIVELFPMDPTNPLSMRRLIKRIR